MNTDGDFRKYITFLWNLSTVTTWIKYNMGTTPQYSPEEEKMVDMVHTLENSSKVFLAILQ